MQNMKKNAFSLIELSIVILIIGILIAGVTQSSSLVGKFRLSSARSLTQNSPVASISGMVFWVDSVSEKSFDDADQDNGDPLDIWYDLNPQLTVKNHLFQSNGSAQPTYLEKGINSLPSVNFNGNLQFFDFTSPELIASTSYTIFVVEQPLKTTGTYNYFIAPKVPGCATSKCFNMGHENLVSGTYTFYVSHLGNYIFTTSANIPGFSYRPRTTNIHSTYYTIGGARKYFFKGTVGATGNNAAQLTGNTSMTIGNAFGFGGGYYQGMIGEIIIYNRALLNEERWEVEKYLAKKWGVTDLKKSS
jgi:prepilin-type N-terminal cleavage/methylation domain-containing protein